jgi:GTPase
LNGNIYPCICVFFQTLSDVQLKWRLREGHGEAIYEIGVEDTGMLTGLSAEDMKSSLITLDEMAHKLGATTSVLRERSVKKDKMVAEVLVRKVCIYSI